MHKKKLSKNFYVYLFKIKQLYILDQVQNRKNFSNYQANYQKELYLLFEKSGNFFHRVNKEIGLNPSPPVHFRSLFKDTLFLPPPFLPSLHNERTFRITSSLKKLKQVYRHKEKKMKRWKEFMNKLVHSCI